VAAPRRKLARRHRTRQWALTRAPAPEPIVLKLEYAFAELRRLIGARGAQIERQALFRF
jgi:hypothetical protein